jgi:hypothetical protein
LLGLFDLLGGLLAIYTAYAVWTGAVYARHRAWGRSFLRSEAPFNYWSTVVVYTGLALALVFYF